MYGLLDLSLGGYILATFILTQITIAAVTLYLHRCQAHKAVELHPVISHFFRFWLWLTTGQNTKAWAAIHRKHHARCETEDDPHSPQVLGLRKVMREGAELYQKEAANEETLRKYGHGTPDDWIERKLYTPYNYLGIAIMFGIDLLLFGLPGITIWAIQMIWIPFWAAGVINGVGHYYGYRNFECPDAATNISPWGLFIGGEELHNNHHTFGTSAKFSVKWYEVDIGWGYLKVLSWLKLAKINRVAPKLVREDERQHVDLATLTAIVNNRYQVLAQYSRDVVKPIWKAERAKAEAAMADLLKRARRGLFRDERLLKGVDKERLQKALAENEMLRKVQHFREQLQQLWQNASLSREELVAALRKWCEEAEATGIRVLQDFARSLRAVVPQSLPQSLPATA